MYMRVITFYFSKQKIFYYLMFIDGKFDNFGNNSDSSFVLAFDHSDNDGDRK